MPACRIARAAAARTTSQCTFGVMSSPHTRPALLMAWNTGPCARLGALVQASTAAFTPSRYRHGAHVAAPLPTRSAITHCSSRCWIDSSVNASNSARRKPQPINIATIAWPRNARAVSIASRVRATAGPRPASAAWHEIRRTAASRRLIVAGAYWRCSRWIRQRRSTVRLNAKRGSQHGSIG